jgi:glycosyltransferase involved in cell wall biosynthesis
MSGLSSESEAHPPRAALSAILITRDEEINIGECLACLGFAREVIVVDSGSSDATVAIAQAAGARVVRTGDWPGFGMQKNRALDEATQPWVLSIDADERVTPALRDEILAIVNAPAPQADAWDMPRHSSFCGRYMNHSGWYPDRVLRLFRRGTARFSDDVVHERVLPSGRVGHLRNDLLHISYRDLETVLDKLNRYSSAGAQKMQAQGRRVSFLGALLRGLWAFVRTYLLRLGFLDGRLGFVLAVSVAEGTYYRYLKLWLRQAQDARRRPG